MKMNKALMAGALSLGVANLSNAGTVYMTGSTAFRGSVYATLIAPGAVFTAAPTATYYDGNGTSPSSANYMVFSGTLVGGSGTTVVSCHWSGSESGIKDVVLGAANPEDFIDPSLYDGADHGTNKPSLTVSHAADLAMADNAQSFSRTKSPVLNIGAKVGIIPFIFVRNPGLWTGNNITSAQFRQALGGFCKRAVFSGNPADVNDYVYVSGRDNLSGTRVNCYGVTLAGIFYVPNQIEIDTSGNMLDLDPPNGTYAGDYGFSSGGTLAKTMGANTTSSPDLWNGGSGFSVVAYMGTGDAPTALSRGAVQLTFEGIAESPAAIKEGTYTYWGNEYIYQANGAGSEPQAVYGRLANTATGINNNLDGVTGIKLTDMHCTRTGPTSDPTHN
jgi:hypothetical protein